MMETTMSFGIHQMNLLGIRTTRPSDSDDTEPDTEDEIDDIIIKVEGIDKVL
jgi:hypothetical protein